MTDIPITNEIKLGIYCLLCLNELPKGLSIYQWQDIEVGWTSLGFQVWCKRHNCNILHVDFEGMQHPASLDRLKFEGENENNN